MFEALDERVKVSLQFPQAGKMRLVVSFPAEEAYTNRVREALLKLLLAPTTQPASTAEAEVA